MSFTFLVINHYTRAHSVFGLITALFSPSLPTVFLLRFYLVSTILLRPIRKCMVTYLAAMLLLSGAASAVKTIFSLTAFYHNKKSLSSFYEKYFFNFYFFSFHKYLTLHKKCVILIADNKNCLKE